MKLPRRIKEVKTVHIRNNALVVTTKFYPQFWCIFWCSYVSYLCNGTIQPQWFYNLDGAREFFKELDRIIFQASQLKTRKEVHIHPAPITYISNGT